MKIRYVRTRIKRADKKLSKINLMRQVGLREANTIDLQRHNRVLHMTIFMCLLATTERDNEQYGKNLSHERKSGYGSFRQP